MHNGQIASYEQLRRRVDALIPDGLYHLRRGTSDSEAIFLAALGRGLDVDPAAAMAETLGAVMAATNGAVAVRFAAVHTDGTRLSAVRWASDDEPPSLYYRSTGTGVVVASEPCGPVGEDWRIVPPGAVLTAGRDGAMRLSSFEVTARPHRSAPASKTADQVAPAA